MIYAVMKNPTHRVDFQIAFILASVVGNPVDEHLKPALLALGRTVRLWSELYPQASREDGLLWSRLNPNVGTVPSPCTRIRLDRETRASITPGCIVASKSLFRARMFRLSRGGKQVKHEKKRPGPS